VLKRWNEKSLEGARRIIRTGKDGWGVSRPLLKDARVEIQKAVTNRVVEDKRGIRRWAKKLKKRCAGLGSSKRQKRRGEGPAPGSTQGHAPSAHVPYGTKEGGESAKEDNFRKGTTLLEGGAQDSKKKAIAS